MSDTKKIFVAVPIENKSREDINSRVKSLGEMSKNIFFPNEEVMILSNAVKDEKKDDKAEDKSVGKTLYLGRSISKIGDANLVVFSDDWGFDPMLRVEAIVCQLYKVPAYSYQQYDSDPDEDRYAPFVHIKGTPASVVKKDN